MPAFPWYWACPRGLLSGLFEGITIHLVSNPIVVGGMAAIGMTIFTELSGFRAKKLRVDLSESSLHAFDDFLRQFADRHSWTEEGKNRLCLVGEEVILSLLNEENDGPAEQKRRLVATIRPDSARLRLKSWSLRTTPSREYRESHSVSGGRPCAGRRTATVRSHPAPLCLIGTPPQILWHRHHQLPRGQVVLRQRAARIQGGVAMAVRSATARSRRA